MIAYTSSRPGAIIESGCYSGTNEALRYKDVRVTVVRNPDEIGNNVMVMEIDILLMKGKRNKGDLTTYVIHEQDDNLAFCPIIHFLAIAFADNAFDPEKNIQARRHLQPPSAGSPE